jgi:hypothetical protein
VSADLARRVSGLLNGCLGAWPFPPTAGQPPKKKLIPDWLKGLCAGLAYALLFCALPFVFVERPELHLLWLSIYGSLYAAWATIIARLTSAKILEIINRRVIPELSQETADRIDRDLAVGYKESRLSGVSWTVAILGAAAAGFAISLDAPHSPFQIAWWSVGWLFLFVTAARATDVARFYYFFAKHLNEERNIYVFDPARSTLVRSIAAVGQHFLLFWFGILLAIALLIPFVSIGSDWPSRNYSDWHFWLPAHSAFAWLVVPIASAFSIPFGTMIFLRSENAIRKAVDNVFHTTLRSTEREVADLLARGELSDFESKRLSQLEKLHRHLTTAGSYRGFFISGLSLLAPLIGVVVTLLGSLFKYLKQ